MKVKMVNIIKQILIEFSIPFLVTLGWLYYNYENGKKSPEELVTLASGCFFFVSWCIGQVFRVNKQEAVKSGLGGIEDRLKQLVADLDNKTKELTHFVTGGDSFCYLELGQLSAANKVSPTLLHQGSYPIYGLNIRIVDQAKFVAAEAAGSPFSSDILLQLGDMASNQARLLPPIDLGAGNTCSLDVYYMARNGATTQNFRFQRVRGAWVYATFVSSNADPNKALFQWVDSSYPLSPDGKPVGLEQCWDMDYKE